MTTTPRHPTHWPSMKIRGARRRRLAAERRKRVLFIQYARVHYNLDGGLSIEVLATPEPGAMSLNYTSYTDGFGRSIRMRDIHK